MFTLTLILRGTGYKPLLGYLTQEKALDAIRKFTQSTDAFTELTDDYGHSETFMDSELISIALHTEEGERQFQVERKIDELKTQSALNKHLAADPSLKFFVGMDMTAKGNR